MKRPTKKPVGLFVRASEAFIEPAPVVSPRARRLADPCATCVGAWTQTLLSGGGPARTRQAAGLDLAALRVPVGRVRPNEWLRHRSPADHGALGETARYDAELLGQEYDAHRLGEGLTDQEF